MKEGMGGTFMIYVMLVFLAVYITFLAVAFNYARAFRVKNKVIDIIEQNEGIANYSNTGGTMGQINDYLGQVSYVVTGIDEDKCSESEYDYINENRGYCLGRYTSIVDGVTSEYYKVKTFIRLEIPFMNLGFTIPVKGETRKIERINT